MPFVPLDDVLPDIAECETRTLVIAAGADDDPLVGANYTLNEFYCDEADCDCRRVLLYVQSSRRPGPEAVIGWGWASRAFYAEWLGDDDDALLDGLMGPALNPGSPRTNHALPVLDLVKDLLSSDAAYAARIQRHYALFREGIAECTHVEPAVGEGLPEVCPECGGMHSDMDRSIWDEPEPGVPVADLLEEAGVEVSWEDVLPVIALDVDDDGHSVLAEGVIRVTDGDAWAMVKPDTIPELFAGSGRPPEGDRALEAAYPPLFFGIESAVHEWCALTGELIRDRDMERIYNEVRRRPVGKGQHPIVPFVQAAIRVHMSLWELNEVEYDAVLRRLTRSARTFAMGWTSTNYFDRALEPVFGREDGPRDQNGSGASVR